MEYYSDITPLFAVSIAIQTYHCLTQWSFKIHIYINVYIFSVLISAPDPGFNLTISDIVNDPVMSDIQLLPRIAKEMIKVLHNLHKADLVVLNLSASTISVRNWPKV